MNARVVTTGYQTGKESQLTATYAQVISSGEGQHGFRGALLLADPKTGKSISITLWDSEGDLSITEQSGWWQKQIDRFKGVFTTAPIREHYDVVFSQFPAEAKASEAQPERAENRPSA
jgi:heme-degrading monooxygenase HmoA